MKPAQFNGRNVKSAASKVCLPRKSSASGVFSDLAAGDTTVGSRPSCRARSRKSDDDGRPPSPCRPRLPPPPGTLPSLAPSIVPTGTDDRMPITNLPGNEAGTRDASARSQSGEEVGRSDALCNDETWPQQRMRPHAHVAGSATRPSWRRCATSPAIEATAAARAAARARSR